MCRGGRSRRRRRRSSSSWTPGSSGARGRRPRRSLRSLGQASRRADRLSVLCFATVHEGDKAMAEIDEEASELLTVLRANPKVAEARLLVSQGTALILARADAAWLERELAASRAAADELLGNWETIYDL